MLLVTRVPSSEPIPKLEPSVSSHRGHRHPRGSFPVGLGSQLTVELRSGPFPFRVSVSPPVLHKVVRVGFGVGQARAPILATGHPNFVSSRPHLPAQSPTV